MKKIRLYSDYEEASDHYFAKPWETADYTFFRVSKRSKPEIGRKELFDFLEKRGIRCVPHGNVEALAKEHPDGKLVVYTDEYAHGGKGKVLMDAKTAVDEHAGKYASLFVGKPGECIRHFQYGIHGFEMPFVSKNDWRSNVGSIRSWVRGKSSLDLLEKIGAPYFAIDFTPDEMLATDFQFAPGTKNDGIETFLSPRNMHKSLCEAIELLGEKNCLIGDIKGMWGCVRGDIEAKWLGDDYFWLRYR